MKTYLVVMVVVLMCTSFSWGAPSGQAPQGQSVGRIQGSQIVSDLAKPRIEIDADKMQFSGSYGGWLQDHIAAMLRTRIANSGVAGVAVTGKQFEQVATTQDRIHESGRYSEASKSQVPLGQMVAPTVTFVLTGFADVNRKDNRVSFSIGRHHIDAGRSIVKAKVRLVLEPVDVASGLSKRSYEVEAEASMRVNERLSVEEWRRFGDLTRNADTGSVETDALMKATSEVVDKLLKQFQAPPPPAPRVASR